MQNPREGVGASEPAATSQTMGEADGAELPDRHERRGPATAALVALSRLIPGLNIPALDAPESSSSWMLHAPRQPAPFGASGDSSSRSALPPPPPPPPRPAQQVATPSTDDGTFISSRPAHNEAASLRTEEEDKALRALDAALRAEQRTLLRDGGRYALRA